MRQVRRELSPGNQGLTTTSFPYHDHPTQRAPKSEYFEFKLEGFDSCLGFVPLHVAGRLPLTTDWVKNDRARSLTFRPSAVPSEPDQAVQHRTQTLATYLQETREAKIFGVLDGWRDELYPVYGPGRQLLFSMERSAAALFGIVTYGVHMTAYTVSEAGIKIWTPRRSPTKQTYPGMLDNTVAGGLSSGEKPFDCLIRESMEEASIPHDVAKRAKACGTMTYFYVRDERAGGEVGLCQPECQYVYDLILPEDFVPKPGDNEAVDFQLLTIDEVNDAMAAGRFKPNCAMLLIDFFVRHGILNSENEPHYLEIVTRLHRRLEFPMA